MKMEKEDKDLMFKRSDEELNRMYLALFKRIWNIEQQMRQANDELTKIIAYVDEKYEKR